MVEQNLVTSNSRRIGSALSRRVMMIHTGKLAAGLIGSCVLAPLAGFDEMIAAPAVAGPIVDTASGKLRGSVVDGIHVFRGVPYGASTAGPSRFRPPRKVQSWAGVRDALDNGYICPQIPPAAGTGPLFWRNELRTLPQSEDCLVLNVFSPGVNDGRKRPVMFWCHGGGYQYESGSLSRFDGSNLARRGDVVVVSATHRLNIFGFLDLSAIGGEEFSGSGNAAILDSLLALQWVRANIERFGGDPQNVMLFGQSAGGGTVNTLLTMPSAKGLFHKAAVQSGSNFRALSQQDAARTTETVFAQLGLKTGQISQLQTVPIDRLLALAFRRDRAQPPVRFGPVVDGRVLPEQPFDSRAPESSTDVPIIVGTTASETTYLMGSGDPTVFSLDEMNMRTRLRAAIGDAADGLIALYRKSRPAATPSDIFFAITTDRQMRHPAILQAERKAAQRKSSAHMYLITWQTPVEGGKWRSPHGVDLPFVWQNIGTSAETVGSGPELQALADKISGAWVAFARSGDPSTSSMKWPPYNMNERATMTFGNTCEVVNDPNKEERIAIGRLISAGA